MSRQVWTRLDLVILRQSILEAEKGDKGVAQFTPWPPPSAALADAKRVGRGRTALTRLMM
eukprot:m.492956 g.492956  ORF g.492956 m.492956 type:complete len:60 (-) comp117586_c0_seq1:9-188(-)